jgi:hypothetical protein
VQSGFLVGWLLWCANSVDECLRQVAQFLVPVVGCFPQDVECFVMGAPGFWEMITPHALSITDLLFIAASRSSVDSFNAVILMATRNALPAIPAKFPASVTASPVNVPGAGAKKFSTAAASVPSSNGTPRVLRIPAAANAPQ